MNQILLLPLNVLPISHLLLPLNIIPISHLLLPINVLPISDLLLPLNVLLISHLLLLLLDVLPISHPNRVLSYSYSTQKHQETEAKLHDQRQNEKEKGQYSIRRVQDKPEKGQCPARRRKNKEEKNQYDQGMELSG